MTPAISVRNLSKMYRIGVGRREQYGMLREVITEMAARPIRRLRQLVRGSGSNGAAAPSDFWALHDMSFDVKCGEVVGIVGANGAGKSTLLKIISRITPPTSGRVDIRIGRASCRER